MKILPLIFATWLIGMAANAQTIVPLLIHAGQTNTSLHVPTNTLALFRSGYATLSANGTVWITNSGFSAASANIVSGFRNDFAALGPCDIGVYYVNTGSSPPPPNWFSQLLIELQPVNTATGALAPGPAFRVETSTNLTTWTTITNASFPKAEPQRFFRSSLTLP